MDMERLGRVVVIVALLALAVWRIVRAMRIGMSRRRPALGATIGVLPDAPTPHAYSPVRPSPSFWSRWLGRLVAACIWVVANVVLWWLLLKSPLLKDAPPIPIGVAGIFANFYLIPWARSVGKRCQSAVGTGRSAKTQS